MDEALQYQDKSEPFQIAKKPVIVPLLFSQPPSLKGEEECPTESSESENHGAGNDLSEDTVDQVTNNLDPGVVCPMSPHSNI